MIQAAIQRWRTAWAFDVSFSNQSILGTDYFQLTQERDAVTSITPVIYLPFARLVALACFLELHLPHGEEEASILPISTTFYQISLRIQMSRLHHKEPSIQDPKKRYRPQNDHDEDYQCFVRLHCEYPFPNSIKK